MVVTLSELCADMASSGRHLTKRAARDWWTKGLLPKPQRRGLGRGKGTASFWIDPRVKDQAKAAYDFLALHSRTYSALVALWLLGFKVDLTAVRGAYQALVGRSLSSIYRPDRDTELWIGQLAAKFGRQIANSKNAPADVRHAVTDLAEPFLSVFFGSDTEIEATGLAEYWTKAAPHLVGEKGMQGLAPTDDHLGDWAQRVSKSMSLPAQRGAISSASDYEMIRAVRLVRYIFGHLRRLARTLPSLDAKQLEEFCRLLPIVFGRPAVPILIMILRDEARRREMVSILLSLGLQMR